MSATEIVLWGLQVFLAVFFLAAGAPKVIGRGMDRWTGFSDLPRPLVIIAGVTEVLGAFGLILPMATGILPWLTPLAAIGLAICVLMATGFHIRGDEGLPALETTLWAALASVVAIGRWDLVIPGAEVPGWTLVLAVGILFPATILNIIIVWRASSPSSKAVTASVPGHHVVG